MIDASRSTAASRVEAAPSRAVKPTSADCNNRSISASNSTRLGTTAAAANDGVPKRASATSSHSGRSPSWPIAATTGVDDAPTARHNDSSLNGSSCVASPPPRASRMTPTSRRESSHDNASQMASTAPGPDTVTSANSTG